MRSSSHRQPRALRRPGRLDLRALLRFPGRDRDAAALRDDALGRRAPLLPQRDARLAGGPEREWLERELGRADSEPGLVWRIVVVHHGPWSSGPHGGNTKLLDAHIPKLLAAHGVDLVLVGARPHLRAGRRGTLKYVVSGGGGAPLYPHRAPLARVAQGGGGLPLRRGRDDAGGPALVAHRIDGTLARALRLREGQALGLRPAPPAGRRRALGPGATASPTESSSTASVWMRRSRRARASAAGWPRALLAAGGARRRRRARAPTGLIVGGPAGTPRVDAPPHRGRRRSCWSRRSLLAACATYHDDLARGERAFDASEDERALAIFRVLEPDKSRLPRPSGRTMPTCAE